MFWQIHRSTLVNTRLHRRRHARPARAASWSRCKGHPEKLEVSRSYAELFKGM